MLRLANYKMGRVLLSLAVLLRTRRNATWHWKNIRREFLRRHSS